MNIAIAILVIIVIGVIAKRFFFKGRSFSEALGERAYKMAAIEKSNDKLILVSGAPYEDVKNVLREFCKMYNEDDYRALPRLQQLPGNICAISFPYDIGITTFCFAVNYLHHSQPHELNARVTGWGTINNSDEELRELAGKSVMVYVDKSDKDYDNVSLTTEDNVAYFMPFTDSKAKALSTLPEVYRPLRISKEDLENQKFEDFK